MTVDEPRPPAGASAFASVAESLRALTFRSDFTVREIAAPGSLAPDAIALAGVSKYPARVKCALLSWSALQDSLGKLGLDLTGGAASTTEETKA